MFNDLRKLPNRGEYRLEFRSALPKNYAPLAWLLAAAFLVTALGGCQSEPARFRQNMAYKRKQELQNMSGEGGAPSVLSKAVTKDVADILGAMFGTPQDPALPAVEGVEISQLVNLRQMQRAAGPVKSDEQGVAQGLYREHCAHCHGVSGDGAGPTAAFLNPYPRDYRMGLFKFKSTRKGEKPTHDDLKLILINGIPGTAMPSFALLPEQEVETLIDYVKYLAIRGEVERKLFAYATTDLEDAFPTLHSNYLDLSSEVHTLEQAGIKDPAIAETRKRLAKAYSQLQAISSKAEVFKPAADFEKETISVEDAKTRIEDMQATLEELEQGLADYVPPRLVHGLEDPKLSPEELKKSLQEQLAPYTEMAGEVMQKWLEPQSVAVEEPSQPLDPNNLESIARGRAIFYGTTANCVSCHGESALGDGQRDFYDDWSGEWVEKGKPELTPEYVALGALPPRNLIPRNLRLGVFRGGRRPVDLYWRITQGIEGAQMPAAPMLAEGDPPGTMKLSQADVWDLINYVQSLPYESVSRPPHFNAQLTKEVQ